MSVKKDQNTYTVVLASSGAAKNIFLVMNKSNDVFKCYISNFSRIINTKFLLKEKLVMSAFLVIQFYGFNNLRKITYFANIYCTVWS